MAGAEHAFEIEAPVEDIWRALMNEAQAGVDAGQAVLIAAERPRRLELDVAVGWGLTVRYAYKLSRAGDNSVVIVELTPRGIRWAFSNILMLGRGITPFSLAAAQGLANLKEAVEGDRQVDSDT